MQGRKWTQEEVDYLIENAGEVSIYCLSKHLGRTVGAVKQKAHMLGVSTILDLTEYVNFDEIERMFNLSSRAVGRYWTKRGLKYKHMHGRNIVTQKNLIKFMGENQDLFTTLDTDVTIISRAAWFKEKNEYDKKHNYTTRIPLWTSREVSALMLYRQSGYTCREIGEKMGRTTSSIKYKLLKERRKNEKTSNKQKCVQAD